MALNYSGSGVNIDAGDDFVRYISSLRSPALAGGIGGFAGATELDLSGYMQPVLLSATDGVGTKLLVAERIGNFSTIGIDLVAMCVNDLLVCGAKPLQFLDYIACGSLDRTPLRELIEGVVRGCEQAQCTLSGGETAEMPDVYAPGAFDLAGFATGIAERSAMWPRKDEISPGDPIFGVPSSGIHSNGLSLARKALEGASPTLWEALLEPTRIYAAESTLLRSIPGVVAAAHITGGGLYGNIQRVMPDGLTIDLTYDWPYAGIFDEIAARGPVENEEMYRVFNMGIGLAVIVSERERISFERSVSGSEFRRIGTVVGNESGHSEVGG